MNENQQHERAIYSQAVVLRVIRIRQARRQIEESQQLTQSEKAGLTGEINNTLQREGLMEPYREITGERFPYVLLSVHHEPVVLSAAGAEVWANVSNPESPVGKPAGFKPPQHSKRARIVLQLARQEAERVDSETIEPEHLLLALAKDSGTMASVLLEQHGVTLRVIRQTYDPPSESFIVEGRS